MAVKLRMMRMGRRHRPFFRINAIDGRAPRNGKIIEKLGYYDPIEKNKDKQIVLNLERVKYWLGAGATPSDSVSELLLKVGIKNKQAAQRTTRRRKAKELSRKKGLPFTKSERLALQKPAEGKPAAAPAPAPAPEQKPKTEEKKEEPKA
jgi:small subunit ribosomal protein S16